MKNFFISVFIVSIFLLFVPAKAWSTIIGDGKLPILLCQAEDEPVQYVRIYDRFFKIPAVLIPEDSRLDRRSLINGHIEMHVLTETFDPLCEYIRDSKEIEDKAVNIWSLYHHYPLRHSLPVIGQYHPKGLYIPEVVQKTAVIALHGYSPNTAVSEIEDARKFQIEKINGFFGNENLPVSHFKELMDFDAYAYEVYQKSKMPPHVVKWILEAEHKTREENRIFWLPEKKLYVFSKETAAVHPFIMECFYKGNGDGNDQKLRISKTLSEYELCEMSFLNKDKDVFMSVALHGVNIPFDGKTLDVAPFVKKVRDFVEDFAVPRDDAALQALLKATL